MLYIFFVMLIAKNTPAQSINEPQQGMLIPYPVHTQEIRTEMKNGEPWFAAIDVCKILEIQNHRDALSRLDDDEKGVVTTDTLGGRQELNFVSESGLYNLIFQSRKPEAKKFRKWVTAELLPQLRKRGSYTMPGSKQGNLFATESLAELYAYARKVQHEGAVWVSLADVNTLTGASSNSGTTRKAQRFAAMGKAQKLGNGSPQRWYIREDALSEWTQVGRAITLRQKFNEFLNQGGASC